MHLRIATRQSKLALYQTNYVAGLIRQRYPDWSIELVPCKTLGDKILDKNLNEIGGKALFMKELEQAIIEGRADIAVHSLKDVPYALPEDFSLVCYCARDCPYDAFVSNTYTDINQLPVNSVVGTSSVRRAAQVLNRLQHKNIQIKPCRGNVQTRLQKLEDGQYDAIILAAAGLYRLELDSRIAQLLPSSLMLPAAGQGTIVVESLTQSKTLNEHLSQLNDEKAYQCAVAERAVTEALQGSCHAPIAAFAQQDRDQIKIEALVASEDGQQLIRSEAMQVSAREAGLNVTDQLIKKGAKQILGLT